MESSTSAIANTPSENVPDESKVAPDLYTNGDITSVESSMITVVLNGVTYDAVISTSVQAAQDQVVDLAQATLQDGDYTLSADAFDSIGSGLTLHALSAGNNVVASLTLARYDATILPNDRQSPDFGNTSDLANPSGIRYAGFSVAEPGATWVAHSTRNPSSTRATMRVRNSRGRIRLPADIVLTPRVLVGALSKLSTDQIEEAVEGLVQVLDFRYGDPDFEDNGDSEIESGEESSQAV